MLSEIYLGQITSWNNKQIKNLNKGVKIPNKRITVFRTDGSGDTYAFTGICRMSPARSVARSAPPPP